MISVSAVEVRTQSGTSLKGKAYSLEKQAVLVHNSKGERTLFEITLDKGQAPYPVGSYDPDPSSVYIRNVGAYGVMTFSRLLARKSASVSA